MNSEKNILHKETKWQFKTKTTNLVFENFDFSKTDFNSPIFKNVTFINCFFYKSKTGDARTYNCHFKNCHFLNVDLSDITIGAQGGIFQNCNFVKCNFKNGYFYRPEFLLCVFDMCKLKNIDFHASLFDSCRFIGKIEDCIFRKESLEDYLLGAKPNMMHKIDFSEAILGAYVAFDNCDLSSCIPPKDKTFDEILENSSFYKNMRVTKQINSF